MQWGSGGVTYTRRRLLSLESQQKVWLRGAHGGMGKVKTRHWDSGGTQVPHGQKHIIHVSNPFLKV